MRNALLGTPRRQTRRLRSPCRVCYWRGNADVAITYARLHTNGPEASTRVRIVDPNRYALSSVTDNTHLLLHPANVSPNQLRAATRATERRGAAVAAPDKRLWRKRTATAVTPSRRR
jgi:hypothetical protein